MMMEEVARELLDELLGPDHGWEVQDDSVLISPQGYAIEWDGVSPRGEVSPLRELGLI